MNTEKLLEILANESPPIFRNKNVPLFVINILPQVRKTFLGLEELAESIKLSGLLNPVTIAEFEREQAEEYIRIINKLWHTSFNISSLIPFENHFYILLAGERRMRACKLIQIKKIRATVCSKISVFGALFIQMSENTHHSVPVHEEAEGYYQSFKLLREIDAQFPLAEFARKVGRSSGTIRNAINFIELPESIRKLVESKKVSYGIAIELSKLQKAGESEEMLHRWLTRAIIQRKNAKDLSDDIRTYFENKRIGQEALFSFSEQEEKKARKKVVEKKSLQRLSCQTHYFKQVLSLFKTGHLGKDESPFSEGSPMRRLFQEFEILEETFEHIQETNPHLLSKEKTKYIERIISEVKSLQI